MKKFSRRTYKSISEFTADLKFLFKNHKKIRAIEQGKIMDEEFKERLMLAVTQVNDCRYCSYYHTRLALKANISIQELEDLLDGSVKSSPQKERIALLFAQHWAEQKGDVEQEFKQKMIDTYGEKKTELIDIIIRTINFGNLMGNTFDYFLYKISFKRFGSLDD